MYSTRDIIVISILLLLFMFSLLSLGDWDISLLKNINNGRNVSLDGFFRIVTDSAAPVAILVPVVLIVRAFIFKNKLTRQIAGYSALTFLITVIVDTAIKYAVNRPRPFITYSFIQKISTGGSPSFPSGHTTDAFVTAAVLSLICRKWYVVVPVYVWALLVAYSRMDLGVHYPSDVLAGICLGSMMAFVGWNNTCKLVRNKVRKT